MLMPVPFAAPISFTIYHSSHIEPQTFFNSKASSPISQLVRLRIDRGHPDRVRRRLWLGSYYSRRSMIRSLRNSQKELNAALPPGWSASLRRASFSDGFGFEINDLHIQAQYTDQPLLQVGTALLKAPVSTADLCTSCEINPQAIAIHRAKLRLVKNPDGRWNLAELTDAMKPKQGSSDQWIPIELHDSQIEIIDDSRPQAPPVLLDRIDATIHPIRFQGQTLLEIAGSFSGIASTTIDFRGHVNPEKRVWQSHVSTQRLVLSLDLLELLPDPMRKKLVGIQSLSGLASFAGVLEGDFQSAPKFSLQGQLGQVSVSHNDFPAPLLDAETKFEIDNNKIELSQATGRIGRGHFVLEQGGKSFTKKNQWYAKGKVNQFLFNSRLENWLPPAFVNFMHDFNPNGTADIQFDVIQDGTRTVRRKLHAKLVDIALMYVKVPFQLNRCVGQVDWVDNVLTFQFDANERDQAINVRGTVNNPGRRATFQIDIDVLGSLPIDEKLRQAIQCYPMLSTAVDHLRITGRIRGKAQITKARPDEDYVDKTMQAELVRCHVRHQYFDYPIADVNGNVRYESEKVFFEKISGNNGAAKIECNGRWDEDHGLQLKFFCNNLSLDHQLKMAVSENIREIWDGFRPRGSIGLLTVDLNKPNREPVDLSVFANLSLPDNQGLANNHLQIHPQWFPYEINHLAGQIEVGQGQITLSNIKGRHGRTWMVCQGQGQYTDSVWSVTLEKLLAGALRVDNDFLSALPVELANSIRQLQFKGLLNVEGEITLSGHQNWSPESTHQRPEIAPVGFRPTDQPSHSTSLAWNLRLDMHQASLFVGTPITNVFGNVTILGQHDGRYSENVGRIDIDSLTAFETQITHLKGPFLINQSGIGVGSFANPETGNIRPEPIVGQAFGGELRIDGQKATTENGPFFLQLTLAGAELNQIMREWAPLAQPVTGRTFTTIQLKGNDSGARSYQGAGTLQLRAAEIYELPVVVALLKILNIKQLNRNAFDSSNVDFTIENETVHLNRIELIGDAISLMGNGQIGFDHSLALNFFTVWGRGRFYIPLLSELYREGSKRVLWIKVNGTVGNPQTHREFLPRLNDTIRRLFEPRTAENDLVPEIFIDPGNNN